MNILVINSGSSSLKYQVLEMGNGAVMTAGSVEGIAQPRAALRHRWRRPNGTTGELAREVTAPDHRAAFGAIGART